MYVLEQCQSSWSTVSPPGAPPVLLKHRQSSSSSASPPQAASVILKQRQSSSRSVSRPHAASVVAARLQHNAEERGDTEQRGEALGCAAREARSPASPRPSAPPQFSASNCARCTHRSPCKMTHMPVAGRRTCPLQGDAFPPCTATHMPVARRRHSPATAGADRPNPARMVCPARSARADHRTRADQPRTGRPCRLTPLRARVTSRPLPVVPQSPWAKPVAQVAELVDAQVSGTCGRKVVEVRVFSWAPIRPTSQ